VLFLPKDTFIEFPVDFVPFAIEIYFPNKYFIFINMRLTEQEKKDILSKYFDDTSNELLLHLKRNFPVYETTLSFNDNPIKLIVIDDKSMMVKGNKKNIVNRISHLIEDEWSHLGEQKFRRTIKKYVDGISL